jgi:hypothetical protein
MTYLCALCSTTTPRKGSRLLFVRRLKRWVCASCYAKERG